MKNYVIIVAGGSGVRMSSDIPKQFMKLDDKPLLMHSIFAFFEFDNSIKIIIVLPKNKFEQWKKLCRQFNFDIPFSLAEGGNNRFNSVKSGLAKIENPGLVAVHDAARPLVKPELIKRCFESAKRNGNGVPVIKPADSMRLLKKNKNTYINRDSLRIVQTPQVFHSEVLNRGFQQDYSEIFTDEANVVENTGEIIHIVDGDPTNIKITLPDDFLFAEVLLKG